MYEELIRRLREEPLDSNKAALPIMDLCIDAATAIENLSHRLDMAQGERDAVTRHMIELEQDVCRLKSRLAAYEDTGLEPEEIYEVRFLIAAQRDHQKLSRLRELVQAEQDGRLVALPCKVGDVIRFVSEDKQGYTRYEVISFNVDQGETFIVASCKPGSARLFSVNDIGKTVFLTREEAEAALAKKGDSVQ